MQGVNGILSYAIDDYQICISTKVENKNIEDQWKTLEAGNQVPFFLSWQWISTWIETYNPRLISVSAFHQNKIVCLGLFTQSVELRHGFVHSRQLRLHQTGKSSEDQIWVEYNDFICDNNHRDSATNACFQALINSPLPIDEIVVSMMPESRAETIAAQFERVQCTMLAPCYSANLDHDKENYLASLSSNTRQQIKRSMRLYEKTYGPLKICAATGKEEAIELFHQAGQYHIKRWQDSGFKNKNFINFHEKLIDHSFAKGAIQLLKVSAGDEFIAILYYHISNKQVYFYLQGVQYHQDKKLKPGLVAHTLATNYFSELGMQTYDYMGGYSQYKAQLASPAENIVHLVIQRPRSRFKLEAIARKIKKRIMQSYN